MAKNPCIFTLNDGRKLNYDQMREYMLENYNDVSKGIPPIKPIPEGEGDKFSDKSILKRLFDSDNISETAKAKFKEEGLKYKVKSKEESRNLAAGIIESFGLEDAVSMAEARRFDGGINSSIFAQALDITYAEERAARGNPETEIKLQERWADLSIRYDEWARGLGRDISQIDDFYKRSPIGVVLAQEKKNEQRFKEWFEERQKPYKEVLDAIKNDPEFVKLLNINKEEPNKASRAANRMVRRAKIVEKFDKLKIKNDIVMATVVPPAVWNAAVEVMKKSFLAGESAFAVIEKGADVLRKSIGKFDEDKFKQYWEERLKDFSPEIIEAEKILDKYRDKLKGLSEQEKRELVRKAAKQIIENGGLKDAEFKKILADVIGMGELTDAQKTKIEELVNDINAIDPAREKALSEKTKKAIDDYKNAVQKAEKSSTELSNIIKTKTDIIRTIQSVMQLNTLTFVSLVKNVSYNYWWHLLGRFPTSLLMTGMDYGLYGINKIMGKPTMTFAKISDVQKSYWRLLLEGFKISGKQLFTGISNTDYFQKEIFTSQIRPFESLKEIVEGIKGERRLTAKEYSDRAIKATFGVPAEAVARILNIGDKAFRFASEGAQAEKEASKLGLKGVEKELFILFPKEMSEQVYLRKGATAEKAMAESEATEKRIVREGEESVFQQNNLVNDAINKIGEALQPKADAGVISKTADGLRKLVGKATMPFVKTPLNIGWHLLNLVNPEISIGQAIVFGTNAYNKKIKGDPSYKNDLMQAKKWLATAGVGLGYASIYGYLQSINAVSGGGRKDETEKERAAKRIYRADRSINISKLKRALTGGEDALEEYDVTLDLSWFGAPGLYMNVQANKLESMTEEERKEKLSYLEDLMMRIDLTAYEALEKSVFSSQAAMTQAILDRNPQIWNSYILNLFNIGMNVIQPGTFAQLSRAQMPYDYKIKADTFKETLENNMAARSKMFRDLTGKYPPAAVTIWGDIPARETPAWFRIWGFDIVTKDNFAQPLFDLYEKINDPNLLPSIPKNEFTYNGVDYELNQKQYLEYQQLVGKARKDLLAPFLNGYSKVYIIEDNKLTPYNFSELAKGKELTSNSVERITEILKKLYDQGRNDGKDAFIAKYPEMFKQNNIPTANDIYSKDLQNQADELNKEEMKRK